MIWFVLWITVTFSPIHSKDNVFSSVSLKIQMTMMMVLTISIQVYEWKMRSIKGIARGRRVSVRRRTEIVNEILKTNFLFFCWACRHTSLGISGQQHCWVKWLLIKTSKKYLFILTAIAWTGMNGMHIGIIVMIHLYFGHHIVARQPNLTTCLTYMYSTWLLFLTPDFYINYWTLRKWITEFYLPVRGLRYSLVGWLLFPNDMTTIAMYKLSSNKALWVTSDFLSLTFL